MPNFQEMLRILLQFDSVRLGGPKLYILFATSMKERRQFIQENNDHLTNIITYNIDECISRDGIRAYFEGRFAKFSDGSGEFPGAEQFEKLLDDCGSIFDFAWTAARFISDGDPVGQLGAILDMNESYRTSESIGHYVKLDNLYLGILQRAVLKTRGLVRRVLATIVCSRDWLNAYNLAELLAVPEDDIFNALGSLNPVMDTLGDDDFNSSYVHRPTFQDFLQDRERCTDESLFVDVPAHEHFMALRCMLVVTNLGSSKYETPGTKEYALEYWTSHVRSATQHNLSDELVQQLIWLIGDERALVKSYEDTKDREDIIPFLRSLVLKYQPKESETILALLQDAEANERIASERKDFLKRWQGDEDPEA